MKYVLLIIFIISSVYALNDENDLNLIAPKKLKQVEGKKGILKSVKKDYIPESPAAAKLKALENGADVDTKLYDKVKLIDVVLETLSRSDVLKSSRESVIQYELKVKNAIADYYPTVNFQYELGRTRVAPGEEETARYKYYSDDNYEFVLRQNLYSGNATNYNIKSVAKKLEVAKNQYRIKLDEEIKKAIKAYFDVVFANRSVMVNERNMKKLNKVLKIVTTKYDNGAASIADLTSIKASVANATTKLVKIKSKFIEALRYYEYIVGTSFQKTMPYEKNFNISITDFNTLYQRALDQNRDLINYYKTIQSEKYNQKNRESAFKPKVDLELSYGKIFDSEDSDTKETDLSGMVRFKYNLFNGGRDKNKILESNSKIRDLNYKLSEEKKKIRWNLSKIHTSLQTESQALESTIDEIKSSRKMVSAYWDAFKLGEQDLQTLLQGQRQLNSAETELVNFEKSQVVDFFNILEITGDLASFFDVDPESPKFIDFSKSDYKKTVIAEDGKQLDLKNKNKKNQIQDDKKDILKQKDEMTEEKEKLPEIPLPKLSLEEKINNFIKLFQEADEEKYTLVISDFDSIYNAFDFMTKNSIDENSFSYMVVDNYKLKTKIAHNIFDTEDVAKEYLKTFEEKKLNKKYEIKKIKDVKELYKKYIAGLEIKEPKAKTKIKIVEKLVKPPKKKIFKTNEEFKEKFLASSDNMYTINVSSFTSMDKVETFVEKNKIYDNSFFFRYGDNGSLIKLVYGIYNNYFNLEDTINKFVLANENVFPVVEKVASVKSLYEENLIFNDKEAKRKEEEAEKQAKLEEEKKAKEEAELKAKLEAEAKAKEEADQKAKAEAEQKAKEEAIKKSKAEAAAKAKLEAEQKAKEEAKAKAKLEAEQKAKEEAEAKAKLEAEQKVKEVAEAKAKLEAEQKAKEEAEAKAKLEAEQKAKEEAEAKAKLEAEQKAKEEAEAKAKLEAEQKAKEEAEAKAKLEAEQKAKEEAEAKAKLEAEQKAKEEAVKKTKSEAEARKKALDEANQKAIEDALKEAQRLKQLEKDKLEAQRLMQEEAKRISQAEVERIAKEEARRQAILREKQELAIQKAKAEIAKKAKEDAIKKAKLEAELKAKEEAKRQAILEAQRKVELEKQKLEAQKKAKAEALRIAQLEAEQKSNKIETKIETTKDDEQKAEDTSSEISEPIIENKTTDIEEIDFSDIKKEKREIIPYKKRQELFKEKFYKASANDYTLQIAVLKPKEVSWFIYARALDPNHVVIKNKDGKAVIYYGIYDSKENAKKGSASLHPLIYESNPPIVKIGSVR